MNAPNATVAKNTSITTSGVSSIAPIKKYESAKYAITASNATN
jgi:hypothetical protein